MSQRILNRCDPSLVSSSHGLDYIEYAKVFRETFLKYEYDLFDNLVKIDWLFRKFCYKGINRIRKKKSGYNRELGIYMRNFVGIENRMLITDARSRLIRSYFDELFPDFEKNNPFETKYEYPFKYMTLECLFAVGAMKERMEIIRYCEEQKMTYMVFLDWVINYIYCYNDDMGVHYYEWDCSSTKMLQAVKVLKNRKK